MRKKRVSSLTQSLLFCLSSSFFLSLDRRYIAWLSVVTLAFNYNTWFITARLCFPYHTPEAIPLWIGLDLLADFIYLIDLILFQPRKQFVKGGDVIVSLWVGTDYTLCYLKGDCTLKCFFSLNVLLHYTCYQ